MEGTLQDHPSEMSGIRVIGGPFISIHSKMIILTCAVARISFDSEMLWYLRKNPVTSHGVSHAHVIH